MHLAFITPPETDRSAAAADYERGLIAALQGLGHPVDRHILEDTAAAGALLDRIGPARPVIDGLCLPDFTGFGGALRRLRAIGLIRHPTPLEPDTSVEQRAILREREHALLPCLSRVIASSDAVADRLVSEFGVARDRVTSLPAGAPDAPRSAGSGGTGCHIVSVGALVRRKGYDVLIQALAQLRDLDWSLHIIGNAGRHPAHAEELQALVASLGLAEQIRFSNPFGTSAATLAGWWQQADLFALATHWEGYAEAVAEALRRGVPVAVTGGGATDQLVPQDAGVVCAPGDTEGLSKALRRLIFDRALRADMADAAWQFGRTLPGWPQQAERFVQAVSDGSVPA